MCLARRDAVKDIDSQKWLKLNYQIQKNMSYAIYTPKTTAEEIDSREVFRVWAKNPTPESPHNGFWWYYTNPSIVPIFRDYGHLLQPTKYPLQGRGQDEILSKEQKAEVLSRRRLGESVRAIARVMGVSKSTIAKIQEGD